MKYYLLSEQNKEFFIRYLDSSNLPHSDIRVLLLALQSMIEYTEPDSISEQKKEILSEKKSKK